MIQLQQNRYLWVHFAALALVPLLLDVCLLGLASARVAFDYPVAYGLQFWFVALVCIAPPLWMQMARPFYIFALPPVALRPDALTDDQKRCLTVLMSWQIKALAGLVAIASIWLLAQLYEKLTLITNQAVPLMPPIAGFIVAVNAFFFACLFMQIGVSSGRSLLVSPTALKRVEPYEGKISDRFLLAGINVKTLLPDRPAPQISISGDSISEDPVSGDPVSRDIDSDTEVKKGGE